MSLLVVPPLMRISLKDLQAEISRLQGKDTPKSGGRTTSSVGGKCHRHQMIFVLNTFRSIVLKRLYCLEVTPNEGAVVIRICQRCGHGLEWTRGAAICWLFHYKACF